MSPVSQVSGVRWMHQALEKQNAFDVSPRGFRKEWPLKIGERGALGVRGASSCSRRRGQGSCFQFPHSYDTSGRTHLGGRRWGSPASPAGRGAASAQEQNKCNTRTQVRKQDPGTRLAQSLEGPTLALSSGGDLRVMKSSPALGTMLCMEPA